MSMSAEQRESNGHAVVGNGNAHEHSLHKHNGLSESQVKLETCYPEDDSSISSSSSSPSSSSTSKDGQESPEEPGRSKFFDVRVFLVLMCIFSITQGFALNGVNNVNIPMYERRFKLTSTQTGLEASFYDIIAGCTVLMVGYFGVQTHQPRLLAAASISLAVGSLSMSLPHFITSDYQPSDSRGSLCYNDVGNETSLSTCTTADKGLSDYLYMLLMGQAFHGLAGTVLYTIGPTYIDGSVSSKQSPTYLGIFYGSSALGPAIGYVAGGKLLDVYVDTPQSPQEGLTPDSPAWVGAWWIGFLASSASCFALAFPLFSYPRVLPGTKERRKNNVSQAHDHGSQHKADEAGFGMSIRDMPAAFLLLLKNPAFVCQCLVGAGEGLIVSGLSTFLPKFIANQYNQKNSWAALVTGFMSIPGAAAGQLLGGIIIQKFNMKVRDMIKFNMGCSICVVVIMSIFWARCDQGRLAGVSLNYQNQTRITEPALDHACNMGCGCDTSIYDPVCLNGLEYFTPCHAGCSVRKNSTGSDKIFSNCTCVFDDQELSTTYLNISTIPYNISMEAKQGKCDTKCMLLYVFIPVTFLALLCTFMMAVPGTTIILRSVNDKQRTFALSIQQMCMRFLGSIPGPLLFGSILDGVCLVWQDKCGEDGSCWVYDSARMSQYFYVLTVGVKVVNICLLITAYKLYKPPPEPSESGINEVTNDDNLPKDRTLNLETTTSKL